MRELQFQVTICWLVHSRGSSMDQATRVSYQRQQRDNCIDIDPYIHNAVYDTK